MNTESDITSSQVPSPSMQAGAITVKDILRAIFIPSQREESPTLPVLHPSRLLRPDLAISPPPKLAPEEWQTPATILYEEGPVASIEEASPARVASLGIGTVIVLFIGYMAQSALANQQDGFSGALLYGLAGLIWLLLLAFEFAPPDGGLLRHGPRVQGGGAARPLKQLREATFNTRIALMAVGLVLSFATYVFTADNTFTAVGVIMWVLSIVAWLLVGAERGPLELLEALRDRLRAIRIKPRIELLSLGAFVLIMGVAIFFRCYRLDSIPNEMTSDHVEKLLDSYDVSQGLYHVFFVRNGGREAIQFYLVALAAKLFGTGMSFLTLKIVSSLEALALIPLMILFGRETIDRETGFFAAALLAVSWWHTSLGRLALRISITPLIFTLVLVALIRGIRTGSRRAWLWAGVWMGIGVYAYQALRIVPFVAAAAFGVSIFAPAVKAVVAHLRERPDAGYWRALATNVANRQSLNLALAGLVSMAIFVPMLRVWHDQPSEMWNRVINRTTSSEVAIQGSPVEIFLDNYIDALQMFNLRGDTAWISAAPGAPMLDLITGVLFVLGLIAWLVRLRVRRDPVDVFLLLAGLIMVLPSALAIAFPVENPSVTRASGAIPIVFLLAAWPLSLIRKQWTRVLGGVGGGVLTGALVALLLGAAALFNYQTYFLRYAESYRRSALNPSEVAAAVREVIGPSTSLEGVWLQGWPYWHDYRAIGIEAGDITFNHAILDANQLQIYLTDLSKSFDTRPLVFIVHPDDVEALDILQRHFPSGDAQKYDSVTEGRDFILYVVPLE